METIKYLIQVNTDAVLAYSQAVANTESEAVKDQLLSQLEDHDLHINELSTLLLQWGQQLPRPPQQPVFQTLGFQGVAPGEPVEDILRHLQDNEEILVRCYAESLTKDNPPEVEELLEAQQSEEERHVAYFQNALATKPWEKVRKAG